MGSILRQPQIQRHFLKSSISFQGPGVAAGEEDTRPCIILDYLVKNRMRMAAACARVAVPWGAQQILLHPLKNAIAHSPCHSFSGIVAHTSGIPEAGEGGHPIHILSADFRIPV